MKLNVIDRSNYLKGLLVLISKDRKISEDESNFIMDIAQKLGFDKEFTEDAIETLLENEYISHEPPLFSDKEFARSFIEDGISVAISDNIFNELEVSYLESIAVKNSIDSNWLIQQLSTAEHASTNINFDIPHLSVEKYL